MESLKVPEILAIPPKLTPILKSLNDYRYFLIEGGRGGGKSQAIARFFLYLAEQHNLRIVCGRETQNSISESVYSIMTDLIRQYILAFNIFSNKIEHKKSGSVINFRGFREQGAFNIQGMEGIDLVWIDEAQAITKQTLDVLIPTIRKENAKIFFTMNRHVEDDPVYDMFIGRTDCLHIHIDYFDNQFCTNALKVEAEACKKKSESDYKHIWLGYPLDKADDCVFSRSELIETKHCVYSLREGFGLKIAGFDIARYGEDKSAVCIIQQQGSLHWKLIYSEQWARKDLNFTTGRILSIAQEYNTHTNIIDEDGLGAGPLDTLRHGRNLSNFTGFRNPTIPYVKNKEYGNQRTANAFKLKDLIIKGHFVIEDEAVIHELCQLRYTYDYQQRKILISKEKLRKEGIKSPNLADALIMAVSLVDEIKATQDSMYAHKYNYSKEENLLELAGIK